MKTALISLAVVAVAGVPGVASAATVSVDGSGTVNYQAAPGEANKLNLASAFEPFGFADTGAPLTAGPGCTADVLITCPAGTISATLGDRADSAHVNSFAPVGDVAIDGGNGNDDLLLGGSNGASALGGSGDDIIVMVANGGAAASGGSGSDRLAGLSGIDKLDGDGGADLLTEGSGPAPSTLSGGDGNDRLVGGDADRLLGGNGTDILVGGVTFGDATLGGAALDGGNGVDLITSTGGATITAGPGADFVNAADGSGAVDTISCGPGYDFVWADATDRVSRDCERRRSGPAPALPGTAAAIADAQALLAHRPNVS
jgi:Ca2+-binding RTX toxin-like protein